MFHKCTGTYDVNLLSDTLNITSGYSEYDIFNMDEIRLFNKVILEDFKFGKNTIVENELNKNRTLC